MVGPMALVLALSVGAALGGSAATSTISPATGPAGGLATSPSTSPTVGLAAASRPAVDDGDILLRRVRYAPGTIYERIYNSQQSAIRFLLGCIGKDGRCRGEYDAKNPRYGGKTGLCAYALLSAGVDTNKSPELRRAIDWLLKAKLNGTYAVSMRACALAACRDDRVLATLRGDVAWLVKAAANNGAYTYTSYGNGECREYDNSNGQMAVLGVWAAARRGVEVPAQYWALVERFWTGQQQLDGGWGYVTLGGVKGTKTYGSMTAAGLATLFVCYENLRRDQFMRCTAVSEPKAIVEGLGWLGQNFVDDENPRLGINHYNYWLYCLERVGLASGYKYLGGHDWYGAGAGALLTRQNPDGSWDFAEEQPVQTAFALLFLARGSDPVAMSKLCYGGKWNARPRDLANFTGYLASNFERSLRWQVVDAQAPLEEWHDSRVLYISGAGAVEFTPQQEQKLRDFVLQGGSILSESACNNADFTLDMGRLYKRLFPQYELVRLADDHPIYSIQFSRGGLTGLMGLSNGVRMLAVHSPRELSLPLQMGTEKANMPTFELAANIYFYLTDKGDLPPVGSQAWPAAAKFTPRATIKVARLKHSGNYDPEPLAWGRLAVLMGKAHRIGLEVSAPMEMEKLDAKAWPIASITGTAALELTEAQRAALRAYLAAGGRLIVEAAGGSKEFGRSAEQQIVPLVSQGRLVPLVSSHPIYRLPERLESVTYRSAYAMTLGAERSRPRLGAVLDDRGVAIVFSGEDLSAGMLGTSPYQLRGYSAQSAVSLMTDILCHLANIETNKPGKL